jgi:cysteine desulfurase/selenocysteine lyase
LEAAIKNTGTKLKTPAQSRGDFPILQETIYKNKPLVYLDNAATSQKPQVVIECIKNYYEHYNANIHRGVHYLSQRASAAYDEVRGKVASFINAASEKEIVFVRGTTEAGFTPQLRTQQYEYRDLPKVMEQQVIDY